MTIAQNNNRGQTFAVKTAGKTGVRHYFLYLLRTLIVLLPQPITLNQSQLQVTLTGVPDGNHVIKAVAINNNGDSLADSRTVTVRLAINDVTGPTIGDIKYAGTLLAANTTLTQNAPLTVAVSDPGGE